MNNLTPIPDDIISSKIYVIRNQKVMMDRDLAKLYQVETKQLKRQVRRNIERFPEDFMFQLSEDEFDFLRSQFGTSSWGGNRYIPMVFTEQGIAMLSSVLNSEIAIKMSLHIIETIVQLRKFAIEHDVLFDKINKIE